MKKNQSMASSCKHPFPKRADKSLSQVYHHHIPVGWLSAAAGSLFRRTLGSQAAAIHTGWTRWPKRPHGWKSRLAVGSKQVDCYRVYGLFKSWQLDSKCNLPRSISWSRLVLAGTWQITPNMSHVISQLHTNIFIKTWLVYHIVHSSKVCDLMLLVLFVTDVFSV